MNLEVSFATLQEKKHSIFQKEMHQIVVFLAALLHGNR